MIYIYLTILFIVFFFVDGVRDSIKWSKKGAEAFTWNEHIILVIQRLIPLLMIFVSLHFNTDYISLGLFFLSVGLIFPYIHNGTYYYFRDKIDKTYPKGFFSEPSKTSTAKINFSYNTRLVMFIVGMTLIGFISYKILIINGH